MYCSTFCICTPLQKFICAGDRRSIEVTINTKIDDDVVKSIRPVPTSISNIIIDKSSQTKKLYDASNRGKAGHLKLLFSDYCGNLRTSEQTRAAVRSMFLNTFHNRAITDLTDTLLIVIYGHDSSPIKLKDMYSFCQTPIFYDPSPNLAIDNSLQASSQPIAHKGWAAGSLLFVPKIRLSSILNITSMHTHMLCGNG